MSKHVEGMSIAYRGRKYSIHMRDLMINVICNSICVEEVVAKPYTISTKATPETHNEPAAAKGNKKDLLDVDDDDIGLVDVDDEEEEEEGLDHVKGKESLADNTYMCIYSHCSYTWFDCSH